MTAVVLLLAFQTAAAQDSITQGSQVFAKSCAVAYCHGPSGTAGRAPALAGRELNRTAVHDAIFNGIPERGMPAFGKTLGQPGVETVVTYVLSLAKTVTTTQPAKPSLAKLAPELATGRDLFFDAGRMPSCSACHAVNDAGQEIGPRLGLRPLTLEALKAVVAKNVQVAKPKDEPAFDAIVAATATGATRVYDVTAGLPVARTFQAGEVELSRSGAKWTHASAVRRYSDAELRSILRWVAPR